MCGSILTGPHCSIGCWIWWWCPPHETWQILPSHLFTWTSASANLKSGLCQSLLTMTVYIRILQSRSFPNPNLAVWKIYSPVYDLRNERPMQALWICWKQPIQFMTFLPLRTSHQSWRNAPLMCNVFNLFCKKLVCFSGDLFCQGYHWWIS